MIRRFIAALAVLTLLGCSSTPSPTGTGGSDGGTTGTSASGIDLAATPVAVMPGQEILYECESYTLQEATTITQIAPSYGVGTHHLDVFQVILGSEQTGTWLCPEVIKPTWVPIFVGGTNPDPLTFPAGYGLQLPAGQQLVLQRHLLNTTMSMEMAQATVHLATTTDQVNPAGGFGFESTMFTIPAAASGYQVTTTCTVPVAMHFFAAFGHAHQLASAVDVALNGVNIFHEPWSFTDQPHIPISVDAAMGDTLTLTCTYNNHGASPVSYGTSTTDEMCAWFGDRFPYTGFSGCIDGNPVSF